MPARRDKTKPPTRKELLFAIAGDDDGCPRLDNLKRLLRCLDRRPDLREALCAGIVEEWVRDTGLEPAKLPMMSILGTAAIKDVTDMASDCDRAMIRQGIESQVFDSCS